MAANTDLLRKGYFGSSTTLSAAIGSADTTIPISSTVGWPTDTAIDLTIDRVDANGNKTPEFRETITVVISGNNGTTAIRGVEGTAQPHSAGAVVEITFTAATHNDQIKHNLVEHNQNGTHKNVTTDTLTVTSGTTLPAGDIATADIADSAVTTAKIADDAITPAKLVHGLVAGRVGGDPSAWGTSGTTVYDTSTTDVLIQCGCTNGSSSVAQTVTFEIPFGQNPIIIGSQQGSVSNRCFFTVDSSSSTGFTFSMINTSNGRSAVPAAWIAIGPA